MTLAKGFGTVVAAGIAGGALGGGIGYAIGRFAPGAYLAMFPPPTEQLRSTFNAVEVGVALGVGQGTILGMVVGTVIVALVTWYEIHTLEPRK